jgi:hypothetical protein
MQIIRAETDKYNLLTLLNVQPRDQDDYVNVLEGSRNNDYGILYTIFTSGAVAQILDFFLDHKDFDYSPGEISKKTKLALKTIFREIPHLKRYQLIYNSRRIGKTNMYKLNTDLEAILLLEKFAIEMSKINVRFSQEEESINISYNNSENGIIDMTDGKKDFEQ